MRATASLRLGRDAALLIAGDVLCFLIFAFLGLRNHDEGLTAASILRAAGPFCVAWLVAAVLSGLYETASSGWQRVAVTWLPAWAVGMLARIVIFGRSFVPAFAIVSLLFVGVLLIGWRLAAERLFSR